jgi:hypothetical protein
MNTLHFFQSLRRVALFFVASGAIATGALAQTPLPNSDASTAAFVALCHNRTEI